jgi:alkaline phosphatase D
MNRREFILRTFGLFVAAFFAPKNLLSEGAASGSTFRLAFGSCNDQSIAQPIWKIIAGANPDIFAFLGDNIYADTENMAEMREKYEMLATNSQFAEFREKFPVVATWDDHDYGFNDSGAEYSQKKASREQFLNFFREPANSPRRKREGVYTSYLFGEEKQRTQLILLDLRWFRSALARNADGGCIPNPDGSAVLLGEDQWTWLEEQLRVPAEFRVLGSSVQFTSEEHPWEKWANFPHEKARLMRLLDQLKINNLLVISGDMHFGELSTETTPAGTRLYDFTSSGLNYYEYAADGNGKRVALFDRAPNFGLVTVDWAHTPPQVSLELSDDKNVTRIQKQFLLPAT